MTSITPAYQRRGDINSGSAGKRCLAVLICLASASTVAAAPITWAPTSGTNWGTAANWSPSTTVNTTGTFTLVFSGSGGAGASGTNSFNNVGTVAVDSLTFANTSTSSGRAFRISGSSISMANGTVTAATVTTGTLSESIASTLSLTGSNVFNLGNNHNVSLSTVTGGGSIFKTGAGTLTLTSTASLSGLNVNQGSVQIGNGSLTSLNGLQVRVGSGTSSATMAFNNTITGGTTSASFVVGGTATFQANGGPNTTFSNSNFNVADGSITTPTLVSLNTTGALGTQAINGTIRDNSSSGVVSVRVNGGVWVLNGASTYTGTTGVTSSGILLMNGSTGTNTVTSSGYLGGSGTFGGLVSILSGTLAPGGTSTGGTVSPSTATLGVGALSLGNSATTLMGITGTGAGSFDRIVSTGSLGYGGTLQLSLSNTFATNTSFDLFDFTTSSGSFASLGNVTGGSAYDGLSWALASSSTNYFDQKYGQGVWLSQWSAGGQRLIFNQQNGVLTVVPEPSTIVFAGIGVAMFGASTLWRRRRRNVESSIKLVSR